MLGFIIGGIIGVVIVMPRYWNGAVTLSGLFNVLLAGLICGVVGALVEFLIHKTAESGRRSKAEHEAKERGKRETRETEQRNRQYASQSAVSAASRAVDAFRSMPPALDAARVQIQTARRCWADGAYSPFWSAIEDGYRSTSEYRDAADRIESEAKVHANHVQMFADAGGDPRDIAEFPVRLEAETVTRAAASPLDSLRHLTYQAQKDPVFAQIWEQRRTTAAVISGFANLEQAVTRMGAAIQLSVARMSESLTESHKRVESTLSALPRSTGASSSLPTVDSDQVRQMRALVSAASEIKGEVYRIGHGKYPSW